MVGVYIAELQFLEFYHIISSMTGTSSIYGFISWFWFESKM